MPPFVVRITDEFNTVWEVNCNNTEETKRIVCAWLNDIDNSPINEINIEVNTPPVVFGGIGIPCK